MKKIYFKKWIQNALIVLEFILFVALGGVSDNVDAPTEIIFIIGLLIIINTILLLKYGKFEEK